MKHRLLLSFAALILSVGISQTAFADPAPSNTFTLTLNNPNQSTIPGGPSPNGYLSYTATFTNPTNADINLNLIDFGITYSATNGYTLLGPSGPCTGSMPCEDVSPFFDPSFNATLAAGTSYTAVLFNIYVPLSSAITTFVGTIDVSGGAGSNTDQISTIAGFTTTVTPEPSSWLLLATGLLGLASACRFRPQTLQR